MLIISAKFRALIFSLFILFILILLWWYGSRWYEARLIDEKRTEVSNVMHVNANSLTNDINRRMALISGLKAFVLTETDFRNTLSRDAFDKFAAGLYASTKGIRAIQALPGGVVRFVYPIAGNEQTLGHDLLHDSRPAVSEDVQRTIRTRDIALSNPYELRQGGLGVVERLAVYKSDDALWGLAVIVIDIPLLLDAAGITLPESKIELSLRDKSHKVFYGREEIFLSEPVIARIELPDGYWELAGIPKEGWGLSIQGSLLLFRGVSLTFVLMLSGIVYLTASRQAGLAMAVRQRTAELNLELLESKRAKEALTVTEMQFRELLENVQLVAVLLDVNGRVTFCNEYILNLTGFTREELNGSDWFERMIPHALPEVKEIFLRGLKSGEITPHFENPISTKKGDLRHIAWNNTILRDFSGRVSGTASIGEDITEHKKAVEALLASEARMKLVMDGLGPQMFVGLMDTEGVVLMANRPAMEVAGLRPEDVYGKPCPETYWFAYSDAVRQRMSAAIQRAAQGETVRYDEQIRVAEDQLAWIDFSLQPVRDESGKIVFLIPSANVITERKQAEEELNKYREHLEELVKARSAELKDSRTALISIVEDLNQKSEELRVANERLKEVDRLKSMFIASMSHELRTPLNSVIGFSSILLNQWKGPLNDDQKLMNSTVLRSGKHLLSLINDVIDVSKIEAGMVEVHIEEFDLHDLIAEAVELIKKEISEKKLELTVEAVHLQMKADRRRLLQSVLNLLSNAVKFTEKGSVSVQARLVASSKGQVASSKEIQKALTLSVMTLDPDGDFVEISVKDTGIGIKEEDMPKLFQAFSRLDFPLRAIVPGTGLGLYLTEKLMTTVLKGEIMVQTEIGQGSRFTIKMPVVASES